MKVLREQLGKKPRFNDDQRRRLAAKAEKLGRDRLRQFASIVSPKALLDWLVLIGEGSLRRAIGEFLVHDHQQRNHQALGNNKISLHTRDQTVARRVLNARNEAHRLSAISRQIASAYEAAVDPEYPRRTWQVVMQQAVALKRDETRRRWDVAIKDANLDRLRKLPLAETRADHLPSFGWKTQRPTGAKSFAADCMA